MLCFCLVVVHHHITSKQRNETKQQHPNERDEAQRQQPNETKQRLVSTRANNRQQKKQSIKYKNNHHNNLSQKKKPISTYIMGNALLFSSDPWITTPMGSVAYDLFQDTSQAIVFIPIIVATQYVVATWIFSSKLNSTRTSLWTIGILVTLLLYILVIQSRNRRFLRARFKIRGKCRIRI